MTCWSILRRVANTVGGVYELGLSQVGECRRHPIHFLEEWHLHVPWRKGVPDYQRATWSLCHDGCEWLLLPPAVIEEWPCAPIVSWPGHLRSSWRCYHISIGEFRYTERCVPGGVCPNAERMDPPGSAPGVICRRCGSRWALHFKPGAPDHHRGFPLSRNRLPAGAAHRAAASSVYPCL